MIRFTLSPGREKSLLQRHPWLFSGAIASREGDPSDALCEILDSRGGFLARGFCSPQNSLVARVLTFDPDERIDRALFERRIRAALSLRERFVPHGTTGYRVLNAEGDGLPGITCDRYDDVLVVQLSTLGAERCREMFLPVLAELFKPRALILRNELAMRRDEKLSTVDQAWLGEMPTEPVFFKENGFRVPADVVGGQKTGWFLDQRENRLRMGRLARGRKVLDLFCCVGGFGLSCLRGGATLALGVDASARALELARQTRISNGFESAAGDLCQADVFEDLRARVQAGERWDLIIVDPPAFAKKRDDLQRALRGYKDINRLAMMLLPPGGLVLSCSCSGLVDADLFQKTLYGAALDACAPMRLLSRWGAGADHPVSMFCPEGEYLKAFLMERSA